MSTEDFRNWCPVCEPTRDPVAEILSTVYCPYHEPNREGVLDRVVTPAETYLSGGAEVEGIDNKRWCDFLHRGTGKL